MINCLFLSIVRDLIPSFEFLKTQMKVYLDWSWVLVYIWVWVLKLISEHEFICYYYSVICISKKVHKILTTEVQKVHYKKYSKRGWF